MVKTKKLRIAVWHNLPSGGAKRALWDHVTGLLARGHAVESWCPDTADKKYLPLSELCPEHVIPLSPLSSPRSLPLLGWLQDYRRMVAEIAAYREHAQAVAARINAGGFDVLFANTCFRLTVPALGRYVKLPKVMCLAEPFRRNYETIEELPWVAPAPAADGISPGLARLTINSLKLQYRRVQMREEQDNARHYDRILVNSFYSRESVLRAYGLESEVCYLGIDTDHFQPVPGPREKYFMGFGAVDIQKGVGRAIEALGRVRPELRPKLLWVGNNANRDYVARVTRRAQELGVDFEVRVMVPDAELKNLLGRAAAVIYTSWLEPFGLAPLEANACGTPVIALAEGGVRETIIDGENGLCLPDAQPARMAAVVERFLTEPGLAERLTTQARPAVLARWHKAAAAERLEYALQSTLS
ncbi:MAG TPA: glycosyltransferase family 4 protein [Verrucomicrobiae bacterium]